MIEKAPIVGLLPDEGLYLSDDEVERLFVQWKRQRDSDHDYYMGEFVKWLKEPCLHRDGSFPDPIHVPPEARLPRFKCRDCIDSLLKSPTEPNNWLDRPDKAGQWWVSYLNGLGKRSRPSTIRVWHTDDYKEYQNSKWLYIEEPTPPEGR
jgi:hypothetical protein